MGGVSSLDQPQISFYKPVAHYAAAACRPLTEIKSNIGLVKVSALLLSLQLLALSHRICIKL
jgi:hypothetical protein